MERFKKSVRCEKSFNTFCKGEEYSVKDRSKIRPRNICNPTPT